MCVTLSQTLSLSNSSLNSLSLSLKLSLSLSQTLSQTLSLSNSLSLSLSNSLSHSLTLSLSQTLSLSLSLTQTLSQTLKLSLKLSLNLSVCEWQREDIQAMSAGQRQQSLEAIEHLKKKLKSQLPLQDQALSNKLLVGLRQAIANPNWNVRREAIGLANELIVKMPVEGCALAERLFANLTDEKITIRKAAQAALSAWLTAARDDTHVLMSCLEHGINAGDDTVRAAAIQLFTRSSVWHGFDRQSAYQILAALEGNTTHENANVAAAANACVKQLPTLLGSEFYTALLAAAPSGTRISSAHGSRDPEVTTLVL
ncbi:uncharacterized protein MONBRDRAFT_23793 [Monosiga brevicollis MX1]|uniref:TOG domain-containing protein n=1 Tax=Monosiga brevicollis TaxID=81824 RepID=A9UUU8_MONBE|nr:uncharacterized protein MONBRDRAFT_23793 [Monosiga brevicollis MX1]EDQ90969.1 predicted protein [Monosiga brevicollis MX1]|eukprot:XP_001744266.1 hypothetical protein [Monosiga brevicollis MX1]